MSIKLTFVFGLLLASGWTQEQVLEPEKVSEPEKVKEPVKEASYEANAEVKFGDEKIDDDKLNKNVDENKKTENGVKASAKASASFSFNFEELLAKWFEACKQDKEIVKNENNNENKNKEEGENIKQSEETPSQDVKSPFIYSYNVHARASASSSASSSSSYYYNFYEPKKVEENSEDENTEEPQENVEENSENISNQADQNKVQEDEQTSDVELIEVPEHCNRQNGEPSVEELIVDGALKIEDDTQVEEVDQ